MDIKKLMQQPKENIPAPVTTLPTPAPVAVVPKPVLQERKPAPSTPSAPAIQPFMKPIVPVSSTTPTAVTGQATSSLLDVHPRAPSTPTMTINTRQLMAEVDAMFESTMDLTNSKKTFVEPTMTINTKQVRR